MDARRTIRLLVLVTAGLLLIVGGGAVFLLYETGLTQARANLEGIVRTQAQLVDGLIRADKEVHRNEPADDDLVPLVIAAYEDYNAFGETGEIVLGRLEGANIAFVLAQRNIERQVPAPVPLTSGLAEPMRLALAGRAGSIVAPDYKGERVLAAYRPIPSLGFGIVAKIDMVEIRRPFLFAGAVVLTISLIAVGLATGVSYVIAAPVVRHGEYGAQELRSIVDTAVEGIVTIDAAGTIRSVNPAVEALFGYERDELLGAKATVLMRQEDRAAHTAGLARYQETGEAQVIGIGREAIGRHKDGTPIPIHISVSAFETADGRFFTGIIRDISHQKLTEARLRHAIDDAERANAAKSEFLANMSHELRTPLNSVIGFSEIMSDETFGPVGHANYRGYIDDIRTSGVHLLNLINDMLDISRVEAGKIEFSETAVDARDVFSAAVRMLQDRWEEKGIRVHVDIDEDLPPLFGDDLRLKQIMVNLLANAIKYTPAAGSINVRAYLDGGDMVWSVTDTGIGIDPRDQARILEPFEQVHQGADRSTEGVGLGLHLTKSLTEMHGGVLTIDSAVDEGTRISIRFPRNRVA